MRLLCFDRLIALCLMRPCQPMKQSQQRLQGSPISYPHATRTATSANLCRVYPKNIQPHDWHNLDEVKRCSPSAEEKLSSARAACCKSKNPNLTRNVLAVLEVFTTRSQFTAARAGEPDVFATEVQAVTFPKLSTSGASLPAVAGADPLQSISLSLRLSAMSAQVDDIAVLQLCQITGSCLNMARVPVRRLRRAAAAYPGGSVLPQDEPITCNIKPGLCL